LDKPSRPGLYIDVRPIAFLDPGQVRSGWLELLRDRQRGHLVRHMHVLTFPLVLLVLLEASAANGATGPRLMATLHGTEPNEHLGGAMSMSAAGDVNADGLADLLVGDAREGWFPGERRCYLYYGRSVLDTIPDVVIPQFEADTTEPHSDDDDHFGQITSGGCDVNGDGFDDILITSPSWYWWTGKVYLYHGGAPMDVQPDVAIATCGSSWMTWFWATQLRGGLVTDINDDRCDELVCIVPVPPQPGGYLYFGGAPMDSMHDLSFAAPPDSATYVGSDIGVGDVNADGYPDVVVGLSDSPDGEAAWVYVGGASMDTVADVRLEGPPWPWVCIPGDMNGSGFADVVLSCGGTVRIFLGAPEMDTQAAVVLQGDARVAGGDLDCDGYADLLTAETGRLCGYMGGPHLVPGAQLTPDFEITGPGRFGHSVAFLDDMTGDGWAEFAVSDPEGPGAIYIYTLAPEAAGDEPGGLFATYSLRLAPNPSSRRVTISYSMHGAGRVNLGVYDLDGRLMGALFDRAVEPGAQTVLWDCSELPSGAYVIRLEAGGVEATQRAVVLR
jgi:hypothetical protein